MNINKFVDDSDQKPFHSSGYADAAHGNSIGSSSAQSFEQRLKIEQGRRAVRSYGDSLIGSGYAREATRARSENVDPLSRLQSPATSRQQVNARGVRPPSRTGGVSPRSSFYEPPTRGYNPYS